MKYLFIIFTSLISLSCTLFNNNHEKSVCSILSDSERDNMLSNELNKERNFRKDKLPPENSDYRDFCNIYSYPIAYRCYLENSEVDSIYVNHIISYFCKIALDDYESYKWHRPNMKPVCHYLAYFKKIGGNTQGEVFLATDVFHYAMDDQKKYGYSNTTDSLLREVDRKFYDSKFFKD